MIRVLSVFGTRPEAIKMAPVIRELRSRPGAFESVVCVSAQHREMLDQVLAAFGIVADHDLDLMTPGQTPAQVASRVLDALPGMLRQVRPDVLLVQGDTMTTFASALAAHLERIPVGHVEAGLRTGDRYRPFPEEMNRVLASRLAALHFAPTGRARDALLAEGIPAEEIHLTGNTVIDALLQIVSDDYRFTDPRLAALDPARRLVLITAHRRESFGAPLREICAAIAELADELDAVDFVLPAHPNPDVRSTVERLGEAHANISVVAPIGYEEFANLMGRAHLILTDSGGIQEEAPSLGKPVLVLREVTERPEGIEAGTAVLVGTDSRRITERARELLTDDAVYDRMARATNPYGDGKASARIVDALEDRYA
jgi:UDP-N-acetylglucosamine 2-epimerase (non-hydrolysing)